MKLRCPDVAAPSNRWKLDVVIGCGQDVSAIFRFSIVGMNKINEAILANALQQRIGALQVQLVPTNVWNQHAIRQVLDLSRYEMKSLSPSKFFTLAKQQLQAQAQAKQRSSRIDALTDGSNQVLRP